MISRDESKNKHQYREWLNGELQFKKLTTENKNRAVMSYLIEHKAITDFNMMDHIRKMLRGKPIEE